MSFLGSVNYCRQWIPNYAVLSGPLYSMLTVEGTPSPVTWTSATEISFTFIGNQLHPVPYYSKNLMFSVQGLPPCV